MLFSLTLSFFVVLPFNLISNLIGKQQSECNLMMSCCQKQKEESKSNCCNHSQKEKGCNNNCSLSCFCASFIAFKENDFQYKFLLKNINPKLSNIYRDLYAYFFHATIFKPPILF